MDHTVPNKVILRRVFFLLIIVISFMVVASSVILPYRLYTRDLFEARTKAREISDLIRVGLLSTMISTGESEEVRNLIQRFQKTYPFDFRMIRSKHVEKQHGVKEDEQATDELIKQVLLTGKSRDDWIDRTTFRYVSPFVADERCEECHQTVNGSSVKAGDVIGASEIKMDLSSSESNSIRLILEILALIVVGLTTVGIIFYYTAKKGLFRD